MGEGFKKQKRKFLRNAVIYSVVCGVSCGLFAFGTVYLSCKLANLSLAAWLYAIIAVAPALLAFGLVFLLLKPTDQHVAAQLDKRYGLNEKAQTALAYRHAQGEVVAMLHADTDERLSNLPKEKFNFGKVWQYFLIAVLSVAIFATSLLVPAKVAQGQGGDDIDPDAQFVFTEQQMSELQAIIDNVKASPLADDLKQGVVDHLGRLYNNLMFAEYNSEMIDYVNATVLGVENVVKQPLSYKAIANALGTVGLNDLAKMIADGVQVYKVHPIVDYDDVQAFYEERTLSVTDKIDEQLTKFFDWLAAGETVPAEGEETLSVVQQTIANVYLALNLSSAEDSDSLRTILFDFAKGLALAGNKLTNDTALAFDFSFNAELADQAYKLAVNKYVTNGVLQIFGLNVPADETFTPTYSQDSGNSGEGNLQGGFGKGDMLYGSDDEVYDPSTGEYVKYGEIFNEYYAIVEALLREGNLTEEQQSIIRAYFEILLSGLKQEG